MTKIGTVRPDAATDADMTAVKAVTDVIPDAGAMTSISDETDKIDIAAGTGLSGADDSVSYAIGETDRHVHHYARAFGLAAVPNGEIHVADEITSNPAPFQIDAGNDDWGAWVQVLGSSDTPSIAGSAKFDAHRLTIVSVQTANVTYFIQIAVGTSGAAALAAGTYTDLVFRPQSVNGRPAPIPLGMRRADAGTKSWARNLARGENTATLSFYLEVHEYEG